MIAFGAPEMALTPDALEAAYGRKAQLVRVDGAIGAEFLQALRGYVEDPMTMML